MKKPCIRLASSFDLDELIRLEKAGFDKDLFTDDQIEYLLTRAHSTVFMAESDGAIAGAAYMLWRTSLPIGRLYNIVVNPVFRGKGIGRALMEECELESARRGCNRMLLEVRSDNSSAIAFYKKYGYTAIDSLPDYYEDGMAGIKMRKDFNISVPNSLKLPVPYYGQTLNFTCGAACLIMIMKFFDPKTVYDRADEIGFWKEATLVYTTSGIGGTSPHGLGLVAAQQGFSARVLVSTDKTPFIKTVRKEKKKEIIRLVDEDLRYRAGEAGVSSAVYGFSLDDILSMMYRGMIPIVLVSTYRLTGDRVPHWVVITGFDNKNVFIHDPDLDSYKKHEHRARNIAIGRTDFRKMSRYGTDAYRSAVLIAKSSE